MNWQSAASVLFTLILFSWYVEPAVAQRPEDRARSLLPSYVKPYVAFAGVEALSEVPATEQSRREFEQNVVRLLPEGRFEIVALERREESLQGFSRRVAEYVADSALARALGEARVDPRTADRTVIAEDLRRLLGAVFVLEAEIRGVRDGRRVNRVSGSTVLRHWVEISAVVRLHQVEASFFNRKITSVETRLVDSLTATRRAESAISRTGSSTDARQEAASSALGLVAVRLASQAEEIASQVFAAGAEAFRLRSYVTSGRGDRVSFREGWSEGVRLDQGYFAMERQSDGTWERIGYVKVRRVGDSKELPPRLSVAQVLYSSRPVEAGVGLVEATRPLGAAAVLGGWLAASLELEKSLADALRVSELGAALLINLYGPYERVVPDSADSGKDFLFEVGLGLRKRFYSGRLALLVGGQGLLMYGVAKSSPPESKETSYRTRLAGGGAGASAGLDILISPSFAIVLLVSQRFYTLSDVAEPPRTSIQGGLRWHF